MSAGFDEEMRQVIVYRDEDGNWCTICPSLPGCHSQGETRKAATINIKEAIVRYIEALEANRLPVPDETHEELQALILTLINERLHGWPFQPQRTGLHTPDAWQMILGGIIEPAPGEPSALDMLREAHDQWSNISS